MVKSKYFVQHFLSFYGRAVRVKVYGLHVVVDCFMPQTSLTGFVALPIEIVCRH